MQKDTELASFTPLADYQAPSMPTRDTFQIWMTRARELIRRKPAEPMIADARLRRSTLTLLDEVASPPACGPLVDELDASLKPWLEQTMPRAFTRLVVMPPGDRNHVITAWAKAGGHTILTPPPRSHLIESTGVDVPDVRGEGLLVIPALEDWFIRHTHGLETVRRLLDALHGLNRHILVGCNSWAWQYLVRAVAADAVLPAPETFQAFDAPRLRAWLSDISYTQSIHRMHFRDAATGDDVLSLDSDDKPHDFLVSLAARSRGIPWVAWRLWRRSLRRRIEAEQDGAEVPEDAADDESTLWVIALEEFSLPGTDSDDALLILHALLIHGPLTPALLEAVMPAPHATRRLPALIAAGIVERQADGRVGCAPAAYPAIRTGLTTAGFPIAEL